VRHSIQVFKSKRAITDNPVIDRISAEISGNLAVFFMKGTTQCHEFSIIAGSHPPWQIA
jgi:hypothetical protein